MSSNEVLERGVTIVQLPLLPIVPCTPDLLFQMGLLVGSLGVRMCRYWMSEELIDFPKSARGRPFYRHATLLRLLRVHDGINRVISND